MEQASLGAVIPRVVHTQPSCHWCTAGTGISFQQQGFSNYGSFTPLQLQTGGAYAVLKPSESGV